jgi:IclR family transcriptional regulator, pca regulon regulatory protein
MRANRGGELRTGKASAPLAPRKRPGYEGLYSFALRTADGQRCAIPRFAKTDDKEFLATLAKGLAAIEAFGAERPRLTLSQLAEAIGVTRATARRILHTLETLGYVERDERAFFPSARALNLGFAYLASQNWIARAQGALEALSETLGESSSAAVLQGDEVVVVASAASRRILSSHLAIGSRLSAFHSSMGRIQLARVDQADVRRRLLAHRFKPYTPSTIVDRDAILERIREDGARGFSLVDEELEPGLRSLAVPIIDRSEGAVAALNVNTQSNRVTRNDMRDLFLPKLREAARRIALAEG